MPVISRRKLLKLSAITLGTTYITHALVGCSDDENFGEGTFEHGVASGDPLSDSVILWTRVSPTHTNDNSVKIEWMVYPKGSNKVVAYGTGDAKIEQDFTVKVDIKGLQPNTEYTYKFRSKNSESTIGHTRTLPEHTSNKLTLAVLSCSNYPAGFFHVFQEVANIEALDIVLHLGDYIYEYGADGYATEQAEEMGRVPLPSGDLVTLSDYRTRYAQYRTDKSLQNAHAKVPFIVVWDDHEVANDSWRNGAENHNEEDQGSYFERKAAAAQAYFEWLPIRPLSDAQTLSDPTSIYRQFQWGDLANLLMLDTRHEARDESLKIESFIDPTTASVDVSGLLSAASDDNRQLLGATQLDWLQYQMSTSSATWQILGQQILMGRMLLPAAIVTGAMSVSQYAELGQLAQIAGRAQAGDTTLTENELNFLHANQDRLTPAVVQLLQAPNIPYNMDAWDGYSAERERVFSVAKNLKSNLVVLSGDTHNAWANQLNDAEGNSVGYELATPSVSSPGLEVYLDLAEEDYRATEAGIVSLVTDLEYMNIGDRGMLVLNINHDAIDATWSFVSSVKNSIYSVQSSRTKTLTLSPQYLKNH